MNNSTSLSPVILVFRTSMQLEHDVKKVSCLMNSEHRIHRWNVDLHDCDKVLRIETDCLEVGEVIRLVTQAGYYCEELED